MSSENCPNAVSFLSGHIPGQHEEVGLNYSVASSGYYTELERMAGIRERSRLVKTETGGGNQQGINTISAPPLTAPAPAAPASAPAVGEAGHVDNMYSRYATPKSSAYNRSLQIISSYRYCI